MTDEERILLRMLTASVMNLVVGAAIHGSEEVGDWVLCRETITNTAEIADRAGIDVSDTLKRLQSMLDKAIARTRH
jgi:hypothetical protein